MKNEHLKTYLIFGVIVIVLIGVAAFIAVNLTPKPEDTKTTDKPKGSLESEDKFTITIDEYSIEPQEIKIKAKTLYSIDARKDVVATCAALYNEDLDLQVDLFESREFPIRFESTGNYKMECIDSPMSFNIKVE